MHRASARNWFSLDVQIDLMVRQATARGRTLAAVEPKVQALRLLTWCQTDHAGDAISFDELMLEYLVMCDALGWMPLNWCAVGRHFAKLTGGRKYRRAVDPRTGRKEVRERVYQIPPPSAAADPPRRRAVGDRPGTSGLRLAA